MMIDELIEHVVALEAELQACSARLQEHSDGEALHDLRIGVRRLRSILRPLRGLPEINALELVAAEVGHRSTPLRDTEVLIQELANKASRPASRPPNESWRVRNWKPTNGPI